MAYPGGKGASGVYQKLINEMPPHRVYIETHLGSGAVLRHKLPAEINIGIDIDQSVIERWENQQFTKIIYKDAVTFLNNYHFIGDEFVYADPPYLCLTRRSPRSPYLHDYTIEQHRKLLEVLLRLPCNVMLSGYQSDLYDEYLTDWRTIRFQTRVRSGSFAEEIVWMNYPKPDALHDYRYLGCDYRERARIRKRVKRWKVRLEELPILERKAIIEEIKDSVR